VVWFVLGAASGLVIAPLFFPALDRAIDWLKNRPKRKLP
jgi:hypothetical protein